MCIFKLHIWDSKHFWASISGGFGRLEYSFVSSCDTKLWKREAWTPCLMSPFVIYGKKKVILVQKTWGWVNDKIFILCGRWRWWIQSNAIYPRIIKDQIFYNKQNTPHIPEVRVVLFSAHDDGFKHGSLSYHKLNHSVYQAQQVPISHKRDGWENEQGHSLLFPTFLNHSI